VERGLRSTRESSGGRRENDKATFRFGGGGKGFGLNRIWTVQKKRGGKAIEILSRTYSQSEKIMKGGLGEKKKVNSESNIGERGIQKSGFRSERNGSLRHQRPSTLSQKTSGKSEINNRCRSVGRRNWQKRPCFIVGKTTGLSGTTDPLRQLKVRQGGGGAKKVKKKKTNARHGWQSKTHGGGGPSIGGFHGFKKRGGLE